MIFLNIILAIFLLYFMCLLFGAGANITYMGTIYLRDGDTVRGWIVIISGIVLILTLFFITIYGGILWTSM
uniref:Uncharacterized protein n=1 Tax=Mammaliicoccus phage MSShimriz1 TaxID=3230127 RepID=A0AAU8GS25_9VIRU